jgi:hypothetical protein
MENRSPGRWTGARLACRVLLALGLAVSIGAEEPDSSSGAPERPFDGFYAGVEVGRQNIIGGSLVRGVDTLQQESRGVVSFPLGWRRQVGRFVFGAEFVYGRVDGDLERVEPNAALRIAYENDSQTQIGGSLGYALGGGRRTLLFAYLGEVSRSFDVTIRLGNEVILQGDEQGLLRYGVGGEWTVSKRLRARLTIGSSRASFDGTTNIEPEKPLDAALGLIVQF